MSRKPEIASVPRAARVRAVDTQILTPRAPLAIKDTEGVRWAGQACGGHRQGGQWGMGVA